MLSRHFTLSLAAAVLAALAVACSPRDKEPTGAPGTTSQGSGNVPPTGTASGSQAPSGGTTTGSSTKGTNSSQGASGEGTPMSPPASAVRY